MRSVKPSNSKKTFITYIHSTVFLTDQSFTLPNYLLENSILFHNFIILEGRWRTTDGFATISFQLVLFSSALVELAKSIPIHSLILSSHRFFCLSLFLFTVPCRILFAKLENLET